jgi:hypothetical protein
MICRALREIQTRGGLAAVAALLASCASPLPPSQASDGTSIEAPVEHASAEDCAVIAAIGKSELHWSATNAPNAHFYPKFETPDHRTYLEDCPWKKLGVAEPLIGKPGSPMGFFVTRPIYFDSGAKAWFQYNVAAVGTANGKNIPPFVERELCTLEKDADGWHLTRCKLSVIR